MPSASSGMTSSRACTRTSNLFSKVPIRLLTSSSDNHPPPLAPAPPPCASPAPIGGGGACDSSVLPEIPIQVIQYYRKRGARVAGRSPGSVSVFRSNADVLFLITFWSCNFYHFSLSKSFLDPGAGIVHYPFFSGV